LDVVMSAAVEQPEDTAAIGVLGPAARVEIRKTRLQRVAHRADARPLVVRPGLERHAEDDADALAARPAEIRGHGNFRAAGMYREWSGHMSFACRCNPERGPCAVTRRPPCPPSRPTGRRARSGS